MKKVVLIALATAMAAPADAQLNGAERTFLQSKGYTRGDLQAYEAVRVAPQNEFFDEWSNCVELGGAGSLKQGRSADDAAEMTFSVCESAQRRTVAILARQMGIQKADLIFRMAKDIFRQKIAIAYANIKKQEQGFFGSTDFWRVKKLKEGCIAFPKQVSKPMLFATALEDGSTTITFLFGGPLPELFGNWVQGGSTMVPLSGFKQFGGLNLGTRKFFYMGTADVAYLELRLNEQDASSLTSLDAFQFKGPITFNSAGLSDAYLLAKKCVSA